MDTEKNQKIRVFIGIELLNIVKEKILILQNSLDQTRNKVKWVKKDNLHITLKFLGYVLQSQISLICDKLKGIAEESHPFNLRLTKVDAFPNIKYLRIIWVGPEKEELEKIKMLYLKIEKHLQKLGFEKGNRKFHPHITIGRVKKLKYKKKFTELLNKTNYPLQEIYINTFCLYKSELTPKGANYFILKKFKLINVNQ